MPQRDRPVRDERSDSDAEVAATARGLGNCTSFQKILLDAAAQRLALAAQWVSADEVTARLGTSPPDCERCAHQLRRAGKILGVYVTNPVPTYRYPDWQFNSDGHPVAYLAEILTVLRDFGPFLREPDGLRRTTGWGEVEWFLAPHLLLNGASPAEKLSTNPARVLRAARTEFEVDVDRP